MFLPHEAELIKSIPLSSRLPEDKLIWALSPNGQFSVRSTYSLAMSISQAVGRGASSDAGLVRRFWKKVWSLPVPHKTRHFVWRACREALPTKVNLARRKVVLDDTCDACGLMAESTGHVLWGYVKAQEAWSWSKLVGLADRYDCCSFMNLLWKMVILDRVEEDKVARMVTIAWALWFHRN
mgnify:CR=1 FL=1